MKLGKLVCRVGRDEGRSMSKKEEEEMGEATNIQRNRDKNIGGHKEKKRQ